MPEATPRPVLRSAADWYADKFGPSDIERWKANGEIVIVEQKGVNNNGNNSEKP